MTTVLFSLARVSINLMFRSNLQQ